MFIFVSKLQSCCVFAARTVFTAFVVICAMQAQPYKVVHAFAGGTDGANPNGGLILDGSALYGTTLNGGYLDNGTAFRIDVKTGQKTVLHTFAGGTADGANPADGLVRDSAGNLHGTTRLGGIYNAGTIFRIDSSGELALLYSFSGPDGERPDGGLVRDPAGNFYGTTSAGGAYNNGTVFKLDETGKLSTLYSFNGLSDGASPGGQLLLENGKLHGATRSGGATGGGIVFRVDPVTGATAVLHNFAPRSEGLVDTGAARDAAGTLYRVNYATGASVDVRALDYLTALRGPRSPADLVMDSSGRLYGAAQSSVNGSSHGMIFEISPDALKQPPPAGACVLTPSSQTVIASWFGSAELESQVYGVSSNPQNCLLPGAHYTASWLSNVTPATRQTYPNGGTGQITFSDAQNTSTVARSATIRLGTSFVLTVKQNGYPTISCQYNPPTATIEVPSGGGPVSGLNAGILWPQGADGCIVYPATSKAKWISALSPSVNEVVPGTCSGSCVTGETVKPTFNVAANKGPARSTTVKLHSGFVVTVNQDAGN
jgi:uncharacterized repeat protein (TIGR03803 family)